MPTLPNMVLITPTQGGDSGAWDDKINAAFVLVDAHDHTSGKGVAVPVSGLNINADLPLGGFGFTNLGKISFTTIAAPSAGGKNLFVNSADNELYWRSNSGTNVKITSGTTLNFTLVGGIVGDYSSVGAEVAYDDANDQYTFKDQSTPTKKWARVTSGPVRILEFNTTESVYVELAAPAALSTSYTVTWPADPDPGGGGLTRLVQMGPTGILSVSNTLAASLTLGAGSTITLSTTGRVIHGNRTKTMPMSLAGINTSAGSVSATGGTAGVNWAISTTAFVPIIFGQDNADASFGGERLQSLTVYQSATGGSPTFTIMTASNGTGAFSAVSSATASSSATVAIAVTSPAVLSAGTAYWLRVVTDGSTTTSIFSVSLQADKV